MSYFGNQELAGLQPGCTVIFSNPIGRDLVFGQIKSNNYKDGKIVALANGRELSYDVYRWKDQAGATGYQVKWSGPLPDLADEDIKQYVRTLDQMRGGITLIRVDAVEGHAIKGRFIGPATAHAYHDEFDIVDKHYERASYTDQEGVRTFDFPVTINTFKVGAPNDMRPPHAVYCDVELQAGDIIATDNFSIYYHDEKPLTVLRSKDFSKPVKVIKKSATDEDIQAILLLRTRDEGIVIDEKTSMLSIDGYDGIFTARDTIEEELWHARLRQQPNEAIVLWLKSDNGYDDTHPFVLAVGGYLPTVLDSLQDYIEGEDIAEGLWLMKDITMSGGYDPEGFYEAEVYGEYVPATVDDLRRFGLDPAGIEADIEDSLDGRVIENVDTVLAHYFMEAASAAFEAKESPQPSF